MRCVQRLVVAIAYDQDTALTVTVLEWGYQLKPTGTRNAGVIFVEMTLK